ncbi:MAG: undecaprenyl-phosphate glucose phosphotransferase, partial [Pseudomonadales bacterium]
PLVEPIEPSKVQPSLPITVPEVRYRRRISPQLLIALTAFADVMVTVLTGTLIFVAYIDPERPSAAHYPVMIALNAVLVLLSMYVAGHYKFLRILEANRHTRRAMVVVLCVFAGLIVLTYALKLSDQFSRIWLFLWMGSCLLLVPSVRFFIGRLLARFAHEGRINHHIAVFGTGRLAEQFVEKIHNSERGYNRIVGVFEQRERRRPEQVAGEPVLGGLPELEEFIRTREVDQIVVALPNNAEMRILDLRRMLLHFPVDIGLAPGHLSYELDTSRSTVIAGLPVVELGRRPIAGWQYIIKRSMDLAVAGVACTLLAPALLVISALIKLDSPGPVLFRQKRFGFNHNLIDVYKFRTMYSDQQDDHAAKLATRDDPRITRIGAFLRRWSLDELPQLFNVLTGQMSLVGPRPHATLAKAADTLYTELLDDYASRHRVKPGITGLAQVRGWRGETDTQEKLIKRVESDLEYIDSWSISQDILIMLQTVGSVIEGENAH